MEKEIIFCVLFHVMVIVKLNSETIAYCLYENQQKYYHYQARAGIKVYFLIYCKL